MGLRESVEDIIKEMEADDAEDSIHYLRPYIKILRIALKASAVDPDAIRLASAPLIPQMSPEAHHRLQIEKAKEEFRGKSAVMEEALSDKQLELVDGPGYDKACPTYIPMPADMPIGAKTSIEGSIYQLRKDGRLHFLHQEIVTK